MLKDIIPDFQTISSLRLPQNPFLPIILIKINLLAASALLNYKLHKGKDGKVLIQCQVSIYNTHYYYHYYYFIRHTKYPHCVMPGHVIKYSSMFAGEMHMGKAQIEEVSELGWFFQSACFHLRAMYGRLYDFIYHLYVLAGCSSGKRI